MNAATKNSSTPRNIADLLIGAARNNPDSGLVHCTGDSLSPSVFQSYPELLAEARRVLAGLRRQGLSPQDKVVLLLERPREFLTAFWACVLGGFVPCPVAPLRGDPERWAAQLRNVDGLLDRPLVVTSESLAAELPQVDGLAVTTLDALDAADVLALLDGLDTVDPLEAHGPLPGAFDGSGPSHGSGSLHGSADESPHAAAPEDTALLVLTSGSTGNSKAVRLSHANLLASMAGKNGYHRLTAADTTLNWVSFDHVAALLECHLLPLSTGARQLHVEAPVVLGEPREFLRLISAHGVTMTFTPNFLLGLLNAAPLDGERYDLTRLRHIVSGGEAVVVATGTAFLERFAPHGLAPDALWPAFGMTETCAGSIYSLGFPAADAGQEFANLGTPVEGLRIRVVDERDEPLAEGEVGELQLTGPMITTGYHNNERATAESFTADGWFRSGDLGRIDGGRLTLVGRSKDSVIVNGVNYFSHEIESALEQLDGVARSYVAAFPTRPAESDTEQLVIAFHPEVPEGDETALYRVLTAVRSTVVMHWGFRPALLLPLPKEAFPKTSLGKIQRALMRRRLESAGYEDTVLAVAELTRRRLGGHTAPEGETERVLAEIYAELFDADPATISATANFFDLGGTSLDMLRLRSKIDQRLGAADLQLITVLTSPTVRSLAQRLAERHGPGTGEYDPVVPLQLSGDKTPLFVVHPGVGEVLVFVNLAKYFVDDRPFYALRARGFNEHEKPFRTFEEMVDCYVAGIRSKQPHGPYALAGYSFGAVVAFEIAKILEAEGERVDFVGSFNLPPHIKYRMEELDFVETAVSLAFFLTLIDKKQSLELPDQLRGLPVEEQLARLMDIAPRDRLAELDLTPDRFGTWAELANRITDLGRSYEPSGRVRAMSVFYSVPLRGTKQDWLDNELRRWDEHTALENRYINIPGEHYTLMGPRNVAAFQAILRRELDRAMGDGEKEETAPQQGGNDEGEQL